MGMALRVSGSFDGTGFDLLGERKRADMRRDVCSVCLSVEMTQSWRYCQSVEAQALPSQVAECCSRRAAGQLPHTELNQTKK